METKIKTSDLLAICKEIEKEFDVKAETDDAGTFFNIGIIEISIYEMKDAKGYTPNTLFFTTWAKADIEYIKKIAKIMEKYKLTEWSWHDWDTKWVDKTIQIPIM